METDTSMPGYTDAYKHYSKHEAYSNTHKGTYEKRSCDKGLVDHCMNVKMINISQYNAKYN